MPHIASYIEKVDLLDKDFVGTIAFRNEEIALPDGSKMALGIDDGHWVLVYQKVAGTHFQVFEYNQHDKKLIVDKKTGAAEEIKEFKNHIKYFFAHAQVNDLVTILPPQPEEI